jgi:hypothetical protein
MRIKFSNAGERFGVSAAGPALLSGFAAGAGDGAAAVSFLPQFAFGGKWPAVYYAERLFWFLLWHGQPQLVSFTSLTWLRANAVGLPAALALIK